MLHRPRLIGLLAAHFAAHDQMRVDRLRRLLRSVEEQTRRVPLLVSWSAEDTDGASAGAPWTVAAKAQAVFEEFEGSGVIRAMPRLRGRRAQFQHYSRLEKTIRQHMLPGQTPWVFFSDDDDIWHPRRAEEYLDVAARQPEAEVLASRVHMSPGLSPRLPASATTSDVSRMHAEGGLRVTVTAERNQGGLFGSAIGEYFDVAVAFNVFEEFFRRHNKAVLANPFADIRFRTFLLNWPRGVHRFLPRGHRGGGPGESESWMYFYDRTTEPYNTPPGEEDMQYLSADLPDPKKIAGLRQTLDCVLFQLTPTQGPLRISREDFTERLVGMLVNQSPATVAMALDRCRIHGVQVEGMDQP